MKTNAGYNLTKIFVTGLIVAVAAFIFYAYFYLLNWTEKEIDVGPTKKAKKNPLLAAQMYLQRQGIETEMTRDFSLFDDMELNRQSIGSRDTIIVIDGRGAIKGKRFEKLYQWVRQGGALITSTANPFIGLNVGDDPILNTLGIEVIEARKAEEVKPPLEEEESLQEESKEEDLPMDMLAEIFNAINPDVCNTAATPTQLEFHGENGALEANFDSHNFISLYEQEPTAWISDTGNVVMTYHRLDSGYVYVTIDNRIWTNNRIHCFDHAFVLLQLINRSGKVWFVMNQNAPSLISMIWIVCPVAVISALLCLLLWLWRSSIRMGPIYHAPQIARRNFAEHIRASAVFLWRHQQQQNLLDSLKRDIVLNLEKRIRDFEQIPQSEQLTHMERLSNVSRTDIERAFFHPVEKNRQHFVFACKTLKQIKDKL